MTQLKLDLGAETFVKMVVDEAKGNLESPEYEERTLQLLARHLRRATPFEIERSLKEFDEVMTPLLAAHGPAYFHMWGPHEFLLTGTLADWDVTDRLGGDRRSRADRLWLVRRGATFAATGSSPTGSRTTSS